MNAASVHLALNVFPPVLMLTALCVLAGALFTRSVSALRVALGITIAAALLTIPTYLSGEPAEHMVEELEGVNKVAIHPHEEAGEWVLIMTAISGVAAIVALFVLRTRPLARWMLLVLLILEGMTTVAAFRTASLGGRIRHPETTMARP